jgi:ribosomal protein S18 acetylase RimI-like enzyme
MFDKSAAANLTFRKAGIEDLNRIMELEHSVFAAEAFSRRQYRHLLKSPTCRILLCESDGGLEAMIAAGWRLRTDYLWIYSVAVSDRMRGQGLGTRMIEESLEIAREIGRSWIILEVRVSNEAALHLYHKFGFDEIGFLEDYYGESQDGIRMALEVPPRNAPDCLCAEKPEPGLRFKADAGE